MAEKLSIEMIRVEGVFTNNDTGEVIQYHNYQVVVPVNGTTVQYKLAINRDQKVVLDTIDTIRVVLAK